jgi:hypothetical protein
MTVDDGTASALDTATVPSAKWDAHGVRGEPDRVLANRWPRSGQLAACGSEHGRWSSAS